MQLHEAGASPQEAGAASGPSLPLPPAQVTAPTPAAKWAPRVPVIGTAAPQS